MRPLLMAAALLAAVIGPAIANTDLCTEGTSFTLNGKPTFLLGISYYGALGASEETWNSDLDQMQRYGVNWIRVWATWAAFDNDVSAVDSEGRAREPFLGKLKKLVEVCDRRGIVLDVTLSRGNGVTGAHRLQGLEPHRRAVDTIVTALKPWRNWYLDLSNERNIGDARHTSFEDLAVLRESARKLDPDLLVTASQGGDISREELRDYLKKAKVDFVCPHRPRGPGTAEQTEAKTKELQAWMREEGRVVPVHHQEPFRRGYADYEPSASDLEKDLKGAISGGAAGWCLHNGSSRTTPDQRPRRSFDLREGRLFRFLDVEERELLRRARAILARVKGNGFGSG